MIYGIEGSIYHLHHTGISLAGPDIQYLVMHYQDIIGQAQSEGAAMIGLQNNN